MLEPFQAIKYVSSGITLVAFVVATVAWIFRARLQGRKDLIALAQPRERAALVERTLEFFAVNTAGLTREQQYQLALKQIEARADRFRLVLKSGLVVTVVAAVLTVVLFVLRASGTSLPARQLVLVKFKGEDARFAVDKYYNFVAKVIDQDGNPAAGIKVMWTTPSGGDKAYVDVTRDDGTSAATNIYTFSDTGRHEQVAAIVASETPLGFTLSRAVRASGPRVSFVYTQAAEAASACSDGIYAEGNGFQWALTRDIDALHFVRVDHACTADFAFEDDKWAGTLSCAGGATYNLDLLPNESCHEIHSSLGWFGLTKGPPTRDLIAARYVTYGISGTFQQGYKLSDTSKVVVDSTTGMEVSANVTVHGPDQSSEQFVGRPNYNTDRMWQWQNQGAKGGSLDFQDQQHTFVHYSGRAVLTNSAYWTPALGHNVVSADTVFIPISSSEEIPAPEKIAGNGDRPAELTPGSVPSETLKTDDSIATEVRRSKPTIEFEFSTSGDRKQEFHVHDVRPRLIQIEPKPTGVNEDDLPMGVPVVKGTVTILKFGQEREGGYILLDTSQVPKGTRIRGEIIDYVAITTPAKANADPLSQERR